MTIGIYVYYNQYVNIQKLRSDISAFTLVEIIIVLMIIASFTGLVSINYVQYTEERKLTQAIVEVKTAMNIARSRALSGDIASFPCGDFAGFRMVGNTSADTEYSMTLCCSLNCGGTTYPITTYDLPSNITLRNTFDITFLPFAQGVSPAEDTVIEIKNNFLNKCSFIKVTRIGVIDTGTPYKC